MRRLTSRALFEQIKTTKEVLDNSKIFFRGLKEAILHGYAYIFVVFFRLRPMPFPFLKTKMVTTLGMMMFLGTPQFTKHSLLLRTTLTVDSVTRVSRGRRRSRCWARQELIPLEFDTSQSVFRVGRWPTPQDEGHEIDIGVRLEVQ